MQHGIALEDIYNFDETEYAMCLIATTKLVTRTEMVSKLFSYTARESGMGDIYKVY